MGAGTVTVTIGIVPTVPTPVAAAVPPAADGGREGSWGIGMVEMIGSGTGDEEADISLP